MHLLSHGLDNGPILFHVRPSFNGQDPFLFTMQAVEDVQREIVQRAAEGALSSIVPEGQDKFLELRYSRNRDFTDEIATEFLDREMSADGIRMTLESNFPSGLRL